MSDSLEPQSAKEVHPGTKPVRRAHVSNPDRSAAFHRGRTQNVAIRFDQFTLLPAERRLQKSGADIRLGARAFDMLITLIERAPGLISKRELVDRVWPGMVVEEGNLRTQMGLLRKALGDDQVATRYISTVAGRGYCFTANVSRAIHVPPGGAAQQPLDHDEPKTNLPLPMHRIIDREGELAELDDNLQRHRLVTLVGSGGVGKTRLAVELGRQIVPRYRNSAWLVDLAPVSDSGLIASATAAALSLSFESAEPTAENIAKRIARGKLLLILDNCEHLADAVGEFIKTLLARAGSLTVLATSRESLRIIGEQIHHLNPLSVAPPGATEIAHYGAVALFVELVSRVDRLFRLDAANGECVAEVCRRLDGVPLALEMAATRVPLIGLEGLRSGLEARLNLLKGDARRSGGRHHTLRHMVVWSYDLLDEIDQQIFCRLAIFPGSFSLEAAVAVMAPFGIDHWAILDALWRLREKSLIAVEHDETPRYRLLETLRIFAAERLAERSEAETVALAHAGYYTRLMSQIHATWLTGVKNPWERIFRPELDNIRAAIEWALREDGDARMAIELVGASDYFVTQFGSGGEARRHVAAAMALLDDQTPAGIAARLVRRSASHLEATDRAVSRGQAERAVVLARIAGDKIELGYALMYWVWAHIYRGANEEAETVFAEVMQIVEEANTPMLTRVALAAGAFLARNRGETLEAGRMLLAALEIARDSGDRGAEQYCVIVLADHEFNVGNYRQAIALCRKCLEGASESWGTHINLRWVRINLASYLCVEGNIAGARVAALEALAEAGEDGPIWLRACLQQWALLGALEGRWRQAAELSGFVEAGLAADGDVHEQTEQQLATRLREILEANLSSSEIENCMEKGAKWSEAEALDFATYHLIPEPG